MSHSLERFNNSTVSRLQLIMLTKIKNFFSEVKVELQKCSWPWDPKEKGFRRYKELIDSTVRGHHLDVLASAVTLPFSISFSLTSSISLPALH